MKFYKISDSVMLDTGTWKRPLIGLAGEELTRFGLEFLIDVNNYILDRPGSDVVVVGGGKRCHGRCHHCQTSGRPQCNHGLS